MIHFGESSSGIGMKKGMNFVTIVLILLIGLACWTTVHAKDVELDRSGGYVSLSALFKNV